MAERLPIVIDLTSESEVDSRPRKRRRTDESSNEAPGRLGDVDTEPTSLDDESATQVGQTPAGYEGQDDTIRRQQMSHVAVPGTAYPRSVHEGYEPLLALFPEHEALAELRRAHNSSLSNAQDQPEYLYLHLDDFAIYRTNSTPKQTMYIEQEEIELEGRRRNGVGGSHEHELIGLHRLQNHRGPERLLFDGILTHGNESRYVQGVPFSTLTIDYGEDKAGMDGCVFIQSRHAKRHHPAVWYQLGNPAQEYARFYDPFVWLAQFTKYFVDYLLLHEGVTLQRFRSDFGIHLQRKYAGKEEYYAWLQHAPLPCGRRDFRGSVAANVGFLWKECHGLSGTEGDSLLQHPFWGEVDELQLSAIPRQQDLKTHTVVTPYAFEAFKHMYFADRLEQTVPGTSISRRMARKKLKLGLTPLGTASTNGPTNATTGTDGFFKVQPGDVVAVLPEVDGLWKSKEETWYAYVQEVRKKGKSGKELHVIWLYHPSDTTIGTAIYPFMNELFLSDNCDDYDVACVTGKVEVAWFVRDPAATPGFFVRQRFRTVHEEDTNDFVSLKHSDFVCGCDSQSSVYDDCIQQFSLNDTVFVRKFNAALHKDSLEPAQIVGFDGDSKRVAIRWLARKTTTDPRARPNELLLTPEATLVAASRIIRRCHVRFFQHEVVDGGGLPTPYDQNGSGDCFYVRYQDELHLSQQLRASSESRVNADLNEGLSAEEPRELRKLRGMGIFCGGGSFDRGLEDGAAVEFKYAIDWAERALHTYRVNARDPENTKYWLGSINDYHAKALAGQESDDRVAKPGQLDLISAGSPCPGFSMLQTDKLSKQSRTNASMIASVVSFVDLYSPKYCFLENVVAMTYSGGPRKDENVFCHIISAFVAMGYQVQQFLMEGWNHGSPQQRSRVFIVASAPGIKPLPEPPHTHQHPLNMKGRALGRSTNGLAFGMRKTHDQFEPPFPYVTPFQATQDLPDIGDGQVQLCSQFPDHRTPCELSRHLRTCIAVVPVRPEGMGLIQAYHAGGVPPRSEPWSYVQKLNPIRSRLNSKTLARVVGHGLFPTVTTVLQVHDGNSGQCVHWRQHRMLTAMEARRAQGFPDDEVIIGSPAQQVKIIGNSVDRKVSMVLGLALRESWLKSAATSSGVSDRGGDALAADAVADGDDGARNEARAVEDAENASSTLQLQTDPNTDAEQDTELTVNDNTYDLEHDGWKDTAVYAIDNPATPRQETSPAAGIEQLGNTLSVDSTYDLERGAWEDGAVYAIDAPRVREESTSARSSLVRQSRTGTLRLSDAQKEDIRAHGFKAIARMMPELGSSPTS